MIWKLYSIDDDYAECFGTKTQAIETLEQKSGYRLKQVKYKLKKK